MTTEEIKAGVSQVYTEKTPYQVINHGATSFEFVLDIRFPTFCGKESSEGYWVACADADGTYMTKEVAEHFHKALNYVGHVINMR